MDIRNPEVLFLLLLIPLFLFFALGAYKDMKAWWKRFGGKKTKGRKNLWNIVAIAVMMFFAIMSLAGVFIPYYEIETKREGIEVVILIDTSRSMLAEDTVLPSMKEEFKYPNRLNRARIEALKLLGKMKGESVGLAIFAWRGARIIELTTDYGYCNYFLTNVESADITFTGSNIDHALMVARSMFSKDTSTHKVIIVLSDGELEDSSQLELVLTEAREAHAQGIKIYSGFIGGTVEVMIPLRDDEGDSDYLQRADKSYIRTTANPAVMQYLADITEGQRFDAGPTEMAGDLMDGILADAKNIQTVSQPVKRFMDASPICLALVCLTFLVWQFSKARKS